MADEVLSVDIKAPMAMLANMKYDRLVKTKDIRKEIRYVLRPVRNSMQSVARGAMANDPRSAYKAIKILTYKDANGGNVSLLNRRGGVKSMALGTGAADGGKSGIRRRRPIGELTKRMRGYKGADRAIILRYINFGTKKRTTQTGKPANRGAIRAHSFFVSNAEGAMKIAGENLTPRILKLIEEVTKG